MVVNKKGGNKSKKLARKHITSHTNKPMRYVIEEGEMYATIVKHYGGQCQVMTADGETRLCIVRGKFKGRQRRDNNISLGSWILVGIREWEQRSDGKNKCDLLYVYSDIEKENLKQNTKINFSQLDKINSETTGIEIDNSVQFCENANAKEYMNINEETNEKETNEKETNETNENIITSVTTVEETLDGTLDENIILPKEQDDTYVFDIDEI